MKSVNWTLLEASGFDRTGRLPLVTFFFVKLISKGSETLILLF